MTQRKPEVSSVSAPPDWLPTENVLPSAQGETFDRNGDYVRRWVPELRKIPIKMIHKPWTAPPVVLQEAGVELGQGYPLPIVDHQEARRTALSAVKSIKQGA